MQLKITYLLIFYSFYFNYLGAQLDAFPTIITKITQDDGLSQGSNYFRFEDSKGFMWITGNDAVNRFDGKNIKVYNLNRYFINCPPLKQGYGFAEDSIGNIYIGSVNGLYIYSPKLGKFRLQKIYSQSTIDNVLPIGVINGKLWCSNLKHELATYDIYTGKVNFIITLPLKPIPSLHIYASNNNLFYYRYSFKDANNNIWIVTENQLVLFNTQSNKIKLAIDSIHNHQKIKFYSSYYDKINNKILLGTDNGILVYNIQNTKSILHTRLNGKHIGEVVNLININNKLYFNTTSCGLYACDFSYDTLALQFKFDFLYRYYCFGKDKLNRLWICSDGNGQLIFDFTNDFIIKIPNDFNEKSILNKIGISHISQLSNHLITLNNKYVYNNKKFKIDSLHIKNYISYGGRMTYDKYRKGNWLFEKTSNNITNLYHILFIDSNQNIVLQINNVASEINDLQILPNKRVICATLNGLYSVNIEQAKLELLFENKQACPFKINNLTENEFAVSYINNDMLLFEITNQNKLIKKKNILPGIQSFYIEKDAKKNQYWVGTNQGVYLLNINYNIIKVFNTENGLAGTYIYGLLLDTSGNVYCSHQHGLSKIDAASHLIINYDKADNIQDWDFNNRSFIKQLMAHYILVGRLGSIV